MKKNIPLAITVAGFLMILSLAAAQAESQVAQRFTLHPGWNAVFLEVQPDPRTPAIVFNGLEYLDSVWTWLSRESTVEFIQNPSEGLWGEPGWHVYLKADQDDFRNQLTNLYAILGNQAYLIKISPDAPEEIVWQVSGAPALRKIKWLPNSFNLVGAHLNAGSPPTFQSFFAPSSAHTSQAVYRLNKQTGRWTMVENSALTAMGSGEAFWVYCDGTSTYQGPLHVDLPMSDGLHYQSTLTVHTITLSNLSDAPRTITLSLTVDVALTFRQFDMTNGYFEWRALAEMAPVVIEPGRSQNVWLAVRREQMPTGLSESILRLTDNKGILIQVPVSAERIQ
jgi:hypothetical protein